MGARTTRFGLAGATFAPGGVFGQEVYFDSMTMFVSFLLGVPGLLAVWQLRDRIRTLDVSR